MRQWNFSCAKFLREIGKFRSKGRVPSKAAVEFARGVSKRLQRCYSAHNYTQLYASSRLMKLDGLLSGHLVRWLVLCTALWSIFIEGTPNTCEGSTDLLSYVNLQKGLSDPAWNWFRWPCNLFVILGGFIRNHL